MTMNMKRIFTLCAVLLVAVTAMAQDGAKRYGIKSGEFETEMDMMGQKIASTTYFDDYGAKQYARTKMEMMGMSIDMGTLQLGNKTYQINYGDKTVQEMPTQESINYLNLNDATAKKFKVQ